VVADAQAHELGYSAHALGRRLRAGSWIRVLPGVLRSAAAPVTLRQTAMAAVLWAGPDAIASHTTAGCLWGLDGVSPGCAEVTLPRRRDRRSEFVTVHRTRDLQDADRDEVYGIAVTTVTRTLVDLAAVVDEGALELAVEDAFRRRLTSPMRLEHRLAGLLRPGRGGTARLAALLEERRSTSRSSATTGSAAEVRLERLLVRSGLPRPVRQHPIRYDGRTIRVDLAYPERRLAVEFDSLRWHSGRAKLETDAERRNLLRAARWQLVTVTATMLRDGGRRAVDAVTTAYHDLEHGFGGENVCPAQAFSPKGPTPPAG
jgi:very-short-patch-repair endonuclease